MSKIIIWDTESTDLYAPWGRILAFTWMEPHETKPHILRISDYPTFKKDVTDDRAILKDIMKVLDGADMWFTWYGARHDVPLVNSRILKHGFGPLSPVAHKDGWRVAKYQLRLPNNRLGTVSSFFGLPDKTPVASEMWVRARAGYMDGLNYVYKHGLQDAIVTKDVYKAVLPLITDHPNVYCVSDISLACPKCGAKGGMRKRGPGFAQKRAYQKWQCTACKGYTRGASVPVNELIKQAA